ncbi:MAG: hypothetical protein IKJ63_01895 [Clostridia bacterium]|nr:hypothetical protein [Clostridia bacterium]
MKRAICLLLCLVCVLLFSACGKKPVISTEAPTTSVLNLMPDGSIIVGELPGGQYADPNANVQQPSAPVATPTEEPTTEAQIDWIIDVYNTVYNNTKADVSFLGSDSIVISDISVDGIKNSGVDSIVHSVMEAVYKPQNLPLPPYSTENPFPVCIFHVEDAQTAEWKDLGNGQAEIVIYPKQSINSTLGTGQGKMFNVINDISVIFDYMPNFAYGWSEGDIASNVKTIYDGGYCRVVYDRVSMKMISAEYVMKLSVEISNFEILFAGHNVSVAMTYTQTFPATA